LLITSAIIIGNKPYELVRPTNGRKHHYPALSRMRCVAWWNLFLITVQCICLFIYCWFTCLYYSSFRLAESFVPHSMKRPYSLPMSSAFYFFLSPCSLFSPCRVSSLYVQNILVHIINVVVIGSKHVNAENSHNLQALTQW